MQYGPRNNTIQEKIVNILNTNMLPDHWYPYSTITGWLSEYKSGTVSSVISKCKSIGSIVLNDSTGDRQRVSTIDNNKMSEHTKKTKMRSNDIGINKKICDRVKALFVCDFTYPEVSNILGLSEDVIRDIVKCEYNVHKFNQNWRKLTSQSSEELFTSKERLISLEKAAKTALDELVNEVYHLAYSDIDNRF